MVAKQYEVYWINLDPTIGSEIKKTRPCVILSPNEMNNNLNTIIIAPLTSKSKPYPTRVKVKLDGKDGWAVLDQIRTVDKQRLLNFICKLSELEIAKIKAIIQEMLVD